MAEVCVPSEPSSADLHRVRLLQSNVNRVSARWMHRQMNLPCERGPEGRYYFNSLLEQQRSAFSKFNLLAHPPADNAPLAPLRDEVLLIDPCSGHLSAGAEVDLATKGRPQFIDIPYIPSGLWVAPGSRERPQASSVRPSAGTCDLSENKAWNSRTMPDAALRASFGGWTSHSKVKPGPPKMPCTLKSFSFSPERENLDVSPSGSSQWIEKAAQRYIYTSVAQRGYEDVGWDSKLPRRMKPPATTLEKMADPVNRHFTQKCYHSKPELWQAIGAHWNRHQLRARNEVRKPITFTSPCPNTCQIPLYGGVVGSMNMDNIDKTGHDFYPLTMQRTTLPPYTPTAHRPTIPGYTGKSHYDGARSSGFSLPLLPSSAPWTNQGLWNPPAYARTAPLSRMVTTVPPQNPFLHSKRPVFPI
ncbi:spermatogenesis-associated protein 48 [Salmo salar]|uniref:Spermatogenesis-associated protein 48 n=1 Tax=Salmo salar TaxID=8030 RepID=A0A1S3RVD3_SALSA|nr:spermatogenesis-associated protein 48 [Salmo salar]